MEQERAIVYLAQPSGNFQRIFIDQVDGLPPTTASALAFYHSSEAVVLAPGKHTIRVRYHAGLSEGLSDIWLVAERGKSYRIRVEQVGYKFRTWFEDEATGQIVGGIGQGDNKP